MTVTIEGRDGLDDEFLAAALGAMSTTSGGDALESLGWWDLLELLDDHEVRTGVFTLFRAQGRTLSTSAALGGLLAQPYLAAAAPSSGHLIATMLRQSARRGPIDVVIGDVGGASLLLDRPGLGVWIVDAADTELRMIDLPGRQLVHEVVVDLSGCAPTISEADASAVRTRSTYFGRVAAAAEILGAAEATVTTAVEHAANREQFGRPIGTFQAVRHLLAWARTDCAALEAAIDQAILLDGAAPELYGKVVKALAGRNGRRTCERTLQVLGAIGFTADHDHHHFHSRVLVLDSLLGTSATHTYELGSRLRTGGIDPGFAASMLYPGGAL